MTVWPFAVDNKRIMRALIRVPMCGAGRVAEEAGNGREGLARLQGGLPGVIVSKLDISGTEGITGSSSVSTAAPLTLTFLDGCSWS
jgi:hypothetical protein